MFTQLIQQFTRLLPRSAPSVPAVAMPEGRERGWHESSWILSQGTDVIELPAPAAAAWFPDTQPCFHDPVDDVQKVS